MNKGTYKPFDNTEIEYGYSPAEPMTHDYPGCPEEVELISIAINGKPAGDDLEEILFEHCGDDWEDKILESIDEAKKDYEAERGDYLYEQRKERLTMEKRR